MITIKIKIKDIELELTPSEASELCKELQLVVGGSASLFYPRTPDKKDSKKDDAMSIFR